MAEAYFGLKDDIVSVELSTPAAWEKLDLGFVANSLGNSHGTVVLCYHDNLGMFYTIAIAMICNIRAGDVIISLTIFVYIFFYLVKFSILCVARLFQRICIRYISKSWTHSHHLLGMTDIMGRHFGSQKLPYISSNTVIGTAAKATFSFLASIHIASVAFYIS